MKKACRLLNIAIVLTPITLMVLFVWAMGNGSH